MKVLSWTWFWFFVFVTQSFLEMVFPLHYKPIKKSLRERILYDSRITDVYKVRNKMQRQAVFNLEMNMYVWVNESITSIWGYINRAMKSAQVILYIFKLVLYFWLYTRYSSYFSKWNINNISHNKTSFLEKWHRTFNPGEKPHQVTFKTRTDETIFHRWYGNQITWWYVELWNHIEVSLRICFEWPCNFFR